ncbi:unnamed protein product [Rhizoctonia solani]|uniref:Uncharacterized protein n=1 Tax=Rhizoctonia solani TaxID=456999 RepID=A0A8H3E3D9_9AGAM|nr:unnamed protein product [Rhizoctonia solani]
MFDQRVSMELSQHLFDLQMARHMQLASDTRQDSLPRDIVRPTDSTQIVEQSTDATEEVLASTNNSGTGANAPVGGHSSQSASTETIRELIDRSDQLAERFNQVLERFTQAVERTHRTPPESDRLSERFNQLIERFNLLTERSNQLAQQSAKTSNQLLEKLAQPVPVEQLSQPMEQSNRLVERFNQLFEQTNWLMAQLLQPLQQSNDLSAQANELAERLNQLAEHSNKISDRGNKPLERLESVMQNINRVLVGIQHAVVRNCKNNQVAAADCLVNEKGETPGWSKTTRRVSRLLIVKSYDRLAQSFSDESKLPVTINGHSQNLYIPDSLLGRFVCFYGIWEGLCETESSNELLTGKESIARGRLSRYLSSCLG